MSSEIVPILPWWSGYVGTPPETDEEDDKTEWGVVTAVSADGSRVLFASADEKPLRWVPTGEFTVDPDTMPFEPEPDEVVEGETETEPSKVEGVGVKPGGNPFGIRRRGE